LVLRVKEAGHPEIAIDLQERSEFGALFLALILPLALFARYLHRATKTGEVKIGLSVRPTGINRVTGQERWVETSTTVFLEPMSISPDEIQKRTEHPKRKRQQRNSNA